jgi:hypothetical protein
MKRAPGSHRRTAAGIDISLRGLSAAFVLLMYCGSAAAQASELPQPMPQATPPARLSPLLGGGGGRPPPHPMENAMREYMTRELWRPVARERYQARFEIEALAASCAGRDPALRARFDEVLRKHDQETRFAYRARSSTMHLNTPEQIVKWMGGLDENFKREEERLMAEADARPQPQGLPLASRVSADAAPLGMDFRSMAKARAEQSVGADMQGLSRKAKAARCEERISRLESSL